MSYNEMQLNFIELKMLQQAHQLHQFKLIAEFYKYTMVRFVIITREHFS